MSIAPPVDAPYFVVVDDDVEPVPVPEVLDAPDVPEGDVLDDEDMPPEDDGAVLDELSVLDGVVDDELLVLGPLMELEPEVDGLVVLLESVVVDDELDEVAGGVAGVVVVVELELLGPGGVTTVLSLRSQADSPSASAMATALVNMILDFMGNSFPCYGDGLTRLERNRRQGRPFRPLPVASSVPSEPRGARPRRFWIRLLHALRLTAGAVEFVPPRCKDFRGGSRRREKKPNRFRADTRRRCGNGLCTTRSKNAAAPAARCGRCVHRVVHAPCERSRRDGTRAAAREYSTQPRTRIEERMPVALIVEDDADARATLSELVEAEGFRTLGAGTLAEAREQLLQPVDIVLLDLRLPDGQGLDLLRGREVASDTQVVVITGNATIENSIEALRLGATDYLLKPFNITQLNGILSRVVRPSELKAEVVELREELRALGRFGKLVGTSPPMQRLYDEIARVAPTGATVLITGESGTGKELVAETVHMLSRRHNKPFLAVNCGAISPHLMESELFGHEKGSFTGAQRQHQGYFERAHGGTLFLDEVTEMPLELQVKLLRVLESRTVLRIGSNQLIPTDARVIAATNRNPEEAVKAGKLRRDLLYRLQVVPLHVVPLRERLEDVPPLARHFLAELNRRSETEKTFAPMALERMRRYRWPGNVRELWNVVQRAFIMADGDIISEFSVAQDAQLQQDGNARYIRIPLGTKLAEVEERLILTTLQECATREEAAKKLGISIKTLYNRLRAYSSRV